MRKGFSTSPSASVPRLRAARRRLAALVLMSGVAALSPALADEGDYYRGRQIQIVVSTEPGTVYDAYARLLAQYLPAHVPGRPSTLVQNMPGGGGLRAANFINNLAPRDGTVFAGTHNAVLTMSLIAPDQAKFDERRFAWIGSVTKDPYVAVVGKNVPIASLEEAKTTSVSMGGPSAGSLGVDLPVVVNALFGTKFRVVAGYKDPVEVRLAMQRGEVDGTFSVSWSELKQSNLVRDGVFRVIAQHGLSRTPEIGDAPMLMDQAKTDEDRAALLFMLGRQEAARPYFAPPDTPRERLDILRAAFAETLRDPEFVAQARGANLAIDGPMGGADLAKFVDTLMSTPRSVTDRLQAILAKSR